ncbi:hypothetical protein N7G274_010814 [Stereocaulon virgatum]|uniref:Retrotransposon gag domain-containing protein n=1 Tax=Stereocaulon virgatum TaxID=373712 RepID=A0ABR3ZUT9_9LECA
MSTFEDRPARGTRSAGKKPASPAQPASEALAKPEQEQLVPSIEDDEEEEIQRLVQSLRQHPGQVKTMAAAMAANQAAGQTLRPLSLNTPSSSPHRARQDRGTTESNTTGKAKKREIAHPPLFDGDRANWITFRNKMMMKLHVDEDLYSTEIQRIIYWISRLDSAPSKQLEPYFNDYGMPQFKTEKEFLDLMQTLYLNRSQLEEDHSAYEKLRMKHEDEFMPFFLNFKRLAAITGYDATFQVFERELSRRLPMRLREARVYANIKLNDSDALTEYYTSVDTFFHQNLAYQRGKLTRAAAVPTVKTIIREEQRLVSVD